MKIIVAVKQVPDRDTAIRIAPDGRSLDLADANWTMNEPDAYALEEALQLKERASESGTECEVVVLTDGPERAATSLREALAKGADRALHIVTPDDETDMREPLETARLLAEAIRPETPALVLTGLQSDDLGAGQTGVILAELLGLPHTTLALHVELQGSGVRVKRELEDGWFQHVTLPLPAVLTIQSGGNPLRYATLMGIKKARSKPFAEAEPSADRGAESAEVLRLSPPERTRQTAFLTGTPAEIAAQLIEKLRFEAKVL
jgi:electron transfer flavoprotein beta subunit